MAVTPELIKWLGIDLGLGDKLHRKVIDGQHIFGVGNDSRWNSIPSFTLLCKCWRLMRPLRTPRLIRTNAVLRRNGDDPSMSIHKKPWSSETKTSRKGPILIRPRIFPGIMDSSIHLGLVNSLQCFFHEHHRPLYFWRMQMVTHCTNRVSWCSKWSSTAQTSGLWWANAVTSSQVKSLWKIGSRTGI